VIFVKNLSQRRKENIILISIYYLCVLCVLSEAGGENISIIRSLSFI